VISLQLQGEHEDAVTEYMRVLCVFHELIVNGACSPNR